MNAELKELLDQITTESDQARRNELRDKLQKLVLSVPLGSSIPRSVDRHKIADHILTLRGDVLRLLELRQHCKEQWVNRSLIRSMWAVVEGMHLMLRRQLSSNYVTFQFEEQQKGGPPLSAIDVVALKELEVTINDDGKVRVRRMRVPIRAHLKFVLRTACRIIGLSQECFGCEGWEKANKLGEVRNRTSHANSEDSLDVSELDMLACYEGFLWLHGVQLRLSSLLTKVTDPNDPNLVGDMYELPTEWPPGKELIKEQQTKWGLPALC